MLDVFVADGGLRVESFADANFLQRLCDGPIDVVVLSGGLALILLANERICCGRRFFNANRVSPREILTSRI